MSKIIFGVKGIMRHIIFFLSTLLLLLFSSRGIENNTNLPIKKYRQNENLEKQLYIVTVSSVGIKNVYATFSAEDIL